MIFLYKESEKEYLSEIFKCYSVNSIINACKLLKMRKPLLIEEKNNKEKIRLKGLDKNYKRSFYSQIKRIDEIKMIYIIDLYDNHIFTLGSEFFNKKINMLKNKNNETFLLANTYKYENIKIFDEYYHLYYHVNKNENSDYVFVNK